MRLCLSPTSSSPWATDTTGYTTGCPFTLPVWRVLLDSRQLCNLGPRSAKAACMRASGLGSSARACGAQRLAGLLLSARRRSAWSRARILDPDFLEQRTGNSSRSASRRLHQRVLGVNAGPNTSTEGSERCCGSHRLPRDGGTAQPSASSRHLQGSPRTKATQERIAPCQVRRNVSADTPDVTTEPPVAMARLQATATHSHTAPRNPSSAASSSLAVIDAVAQDHVVEAPLPRIAPLRRRGSPAVPPPIFPGNGCDNGDTGTTDPALAPPAAPVAPPPRHQALTGCRGARSHSTGTLLQRPPGWRDPVVLDE